MLKQSEQIETKSIRVLIVEDYKLTRIGLRSVLKADETIDIIAEAEDGERGLALALELKPDIVLMDLGLPGINGVEVTQQIKAADETIKVIIYTSHEREEEVIAALGAGANAYCLKDHANDLVQTIRIVSEGSAWLDPAIANIALRVFQKQPAVSPSASPAVKTEPFHLNDREMAVLKLMVEGKSNTEIAHNLSVDVSTARSHVGDILQKLSVHDRVQAAVKAIKEGLI